MAASVGESQLQRVIRDLHDAIAELCKEYSENGEPITDDSTSLHKFSYKLEYLLQFDQKEKTTFLGTRKDYWDYFNDCLARTKGANDGIRFVKSIPEFKTSLGKGRAFIRYSLVHQRLADTLQQCFMNTKVTSDWYYARSPFLKPNLHSDVVSHLYELNEVRFDVSSRGYDLDAAWPTFARRTLGLSNSPAHLWKPPSRSSSINSLSSSYSQANEFPSSPDFNNSLLSEPVNVIDELRLELDQSELKQQKLQDLVHQLQLEKKELEEIGKHEENTANIEDIKISTALQENSKLKKVVEDLKKQLSDLQECSKMNSCEKKYKETITHLEINNQELLNKSKTLNQELEYLKNSQTLKDNLNADLETKLCRAEQKNLELLEKLESFLNQKGQEASSQFDTAQKIHELLTDLNEAEKEKTELQKETNEHRNLSERLTDDLKQKVDMLQKTEIKLSSLTAAFEAQERQLVMENEDLKKAMEKHQGALAVKEKEASNLQKQIQDLQKHADMIERQYYDKEKELKTVLEEQRKKIENLEGQIETLTEDLNTRRKDLSNITKNCKNVEEQNMILNNEKSSLTEQIAKLKQSIKECMISLEQYKSECTNLKSENEKLVQETKKLKESNKDLKDVKALHDNELASLRASEKHLRKQIDDALVTVDEKEVKLREENKNLDEKYQKALMQIEELKEMLTNVENENNEQRKRNINLKDNLSSLQIQHDNTKQHISELENEISDLKINENVLDQKLQEKLALLDESEKTREEILCRMDKQRKEYQREKESLESVCQQQSKVVEHLTSEKVSLEKEQLQQSENQAKKVQELDSQLTVTQSQLEVNFSEITRLQTDVIDLRATLQKSLEENAKVQAKLDITETSREEFKTLTEQLKMETESLTRNHIQELMEYKEKNEMLSKDKEALIQDKAELEATVIALKEQMKVIKEYSGKLELESTENKDMLHRANTEMAELGIQICTVTSEKEQAEQKIASFIHQLASLKQKTDKEVGKVNASLTAVTTENKSLKEELRQCEKLAATTMDLQEKLEKAEKNAKSIQISSSEEITALKFQMSSEIINYQNKIKELSEELEHTKDHLKEEKKKSLSLDAEMSELKLQNMDVSNQLDIKIEQMIKSEQVCQENVEELHSLKDILARTQKELSDLQKQNQECYDQLEKMTAEKQNDEVKLLAEIEDLNRTKKNLEERLIELIREKDALWQKSDALEYEQKIRAEERWLIDREVNYCLDCQSQFTWLLRRHHCRLCGRIFCYYCSNNFVMTKHSGKKERCCRECYIQHSAVVERLNSSEVENQLDSLAGSSLLEDRIVVQHSPSVTVIDRDDSRPDDATFDIITEEEVSIIQSDSVSPASDDILNDEADLFPQSSNELNSNFTSSNEVEEQISTVQDAEINLLKSGELTFKIPMNVEDISTFGDGNRELFIKSSCYSIIPIIVNESGATISWVFSSEPKSISFSVVYQEFMEAPVEKSKVLIPLTRCNAHKETIQGQLKVRNPGAYLLIFDNSFSRFVSKKVFYHLAIEKPIIYDGSDSP
ncbi:FYVE and coiled-coil domain-containing protein 1-like [Polypterus senegalus]|uniref:FYVE and coiled-coil domain-containing protein 1-like n=1 Tax=Polypterus senegalus TaxID=55291 RepID=UPI001966853E|nr:FYVE and coiled-coil domain-containing protein 1-like [Polypterus senegalus]XP_039609413.1 FYVE and coiled-coil domain-containing protein 1-like [Polypterus senegalus]